MDYEKKYKNALEWARQVMNGEIGFVRKEVEKVFSELKESEDEKIRKALIKYYSFDKDGGSHALDNITPKQIVAWLEKQGNLMKALQISNSRIEELVEEKYNLEEKLKKQGEQKPIEPQQDMLSQEKYAKAVDECVYGEQNPADVEELNFFDDFRKTDSEVEPKFKVGDSIKTTNEEPLTITDITDRGYWSEDLFICGFDDAAKWELVEQNPAWIEEDETTRKTLINLVEMYYGGCVDKSEKNRLLDWLKSLRPQPKQEVDEQIETIAMHLDNCGNTAMAEILRSCNLRPQNTWKPSDAQMASITCAVRKMKESACYDSELVSLFNDLKKLREG